MLEFNKRGFLIPDRNINTTIEEFEETFASGLNSHRVDLFNKYLYYSTELKKILEIEYLLQWINGSYVTKEDKPGDIDLVTFADFQVIEKVEKKLDIFKYPDSEKEFGVDAYMVRTYPTNDKSYSFYQGDYFYWRDRFGKTKRNRDGSRFAKGFLEIIF